MLVTGGGLSNFSGSGTTYTATFTPDGISTNGVIVVASNAFTNASGNPNNDGADANNKVTLSDNVIPTVNGPVTGSGIENQALPSNLSLIAKAMDANGDALSVVPGSVTYVVNGFASALPKGVTQNGNSLTIDPNNHAFDPLAADEIETITASYQISDGHGGKVAETATYTVTGINDAPAFSNATFNTGAGDTGAFSDVVQLTTYKGGVNGAKALNEITVSDSGYTGGSFGITANQGSNWGNYWTTGGIIMSNVPANTPVGNTVSFGFNGNASGSNHVTFTINDIDGGGAGSKNGNYQDFVLITAVDTKGNALPTSAFSYAAATAGYVTSVATTNGLELNGIKPAGGIGDLDPTYITVDWASPIASLSVQYYTPGSSTVSSGIIAISPLTISTTGQNFGSLSTFLPGVTDIDHGSSVSGYAFTSAAGDASGHHWEYSANGGTTWINMDSASTTAALYLAVSDLIRWSGPQGSNTPLTVVAVDNTSAAALDTSSTGHLNVSVTGGSTPFSAPVTLAANLAPVVLDMNHDGQINYTTELMDVNGNGHVYSTAWAGSGDGVLVWDKYGDGQVHNSRQYAFSQYGVAGSTDLQGLKTAFDTNHDGKLDAGDAQFKSFSVWVDANHNGSVDAGEMLTLTAAGITSINLTSNGVQSNPAPGVNEAGASSATLVDGTVILVADDSFSYVTPPTNNAPSVSTSHVVDVNAGTAYPGGIAGGAQGSEVFAWHLADSDRSGSGHETAMITNFNTAGAKGGGDFLNFHDVLPDVTHSSGDIGNLEQYLSIQIAGAETILPISAFGQSSGSNITSVEDQTIVRNQINIGAALVMPSTSDAHIIQSMFNQNKLMTDHHN